MTPDPTPSYQDRLREIEATSGNTVRGRVTEIRWLCDQLKSRDEQLAVMRELLTDASLKIRAYQKHCGNEYVGGPLLEVIMPRIAEALSRLTPPPSAS